MTAPGRRWWARGAAGLAAGAVVGLAQYATAVTGMHRAAQAHGVAGIGVAATAAATFLGISLVLLLVTSRLFQLRLWVLSAIGLTAIELVVVGIAWDAGAQLGLHGDRQALCWPVVATAITVLAVVRWPRRTGADDASAAKNTADPQQS